ncbi:MAG: carbohydrate kinase family protein [Erysipelotrichaceae bacterium]
MTKHTPNILVFGLSILDIFGFVDHTYNTHDSNPGAIQTAYGGVCRNIAENLTRLGIDTHFISILGDDAAGKGLLEHANKMGLDMSDSLIIKGATTPTYMAILDEHREMVSAVCDFKIIDHVTPAFIDAKKERIAQADYMILDCDDPAITRHIVTQYHTTTKMILDPVSGAKAKAIADLLPYFHTIKPNRHEASALCGFPVETIEDVRRAGRYFQGLGVANIFISLDKDGVYYLTKEKEGTIQGSPVEVLNVTGAGDAFVAGIGYGYLHALSIEETLEFAIAMSIATITHEQTIHPDLDEAYIQDIVSRQDWKIETF